MEGRGRRRDLARVDDVLDGLDAGAVHVARVHGVLDELALGDLLLHRLAGAFHTTPHRAAMR